MYVITKISGGSKNSCNGNPLTNIKLLLTDIYEVSEFQLAHSVNASLNCIPVNLEFFKDCLAFFNNLIPFTDWKNVDICLTIAKLKLSHHRVTLYT